MREFNPPPQRSSGSPPAGSATVFPAVIAAVQVIGLVALAGWSSGNLSLAGLTGTQFLMQPLTAVSCMTIGLAIWLASAGHRTASRSLLAVPAAIALIALVEETISRPLGIDTLLFADTIGAQTRAAPGRPGVIPALSILVLCGACFAVCSDQRFLRRTVVTQACVAIAAAAISGSLLPLGVSAPAPDTRIALMSLPTAGSICLLAMATILLRRRYAWPSRPLCGYGASTLQATLLIAVSLPVASGLILLRASHPGCSGASVAPEIVVILLAVVQVAASCALIAWAWLRIARESSARWAINAALDSAPIAITDLEGRIQRWSNGCVRLYGWSAEEALGRFKHELTGSAAFPAARDGAVQGEVETVERRRDGTVLRVFESRQVVQPRSDRAPMVVLSMTDVTARQRAEEAVLASDARLALAVELHGLGIFEWSSRDDTFEFHGQAERLFGLPPGPIAQGIHGWLAHLADAFGRKVAPPVEWQPGRYGFRLNARRTGQPSIIEGTVLIRRDETLGTVEMIGIVMDATEREQRAETLEARESELRSILETVPEGMITLDAQGRVRSFSATAEALFGYSAAEMLGRDVRLVLPHYPAHDVGAEARDGAREEAIAPRITVGLDRAGNEVPVELAIGTARSANETIAIAFVRDLSDQLATEARLNELREEFLRVSRVTAMGEMSAGLAHELNQPLTATSNLLGAIELLLQRDGSRDQQRRMLRLANQEVLRAGDIIRRMRAFVSKGELDFRAEPLDEVIAETLQLARSRSRAPGVRLRYRPCAGSPRILADRIHIQQVLVNIINNAYDALEGDPVASPVITIATQEPGDGHVMIRVSDNGPGLPEQIVNRPFEAFASTKQSGMGLGLSICRRIVEAHGGQLTVGNAEEGGAMIAFSLPSYHELELKAG